MIDFRATAQYENEKKNTVSVEFLYIYFLLYVGHILFIFFVLLLL